ncbi:MAG: hypothetical protein KAH22_02995 [Thiotrichaceae bacterium]|nr:hypothetical protein [Thiotrichaceae bacterium]
MMNKLFNKTLVNLMVLLFGIFLILASGGGGGGDGGGGAITGSLSFLLKGSNITINGAGYNTSTVSRRGGTTTTNGQFSYIAGDTITFTIDGKNYSTSTKAAITLVDLITDSDERNNLKQVLLYVDSDSSTGAVTLDANNPSGLDQSLPREDFMKAYSKLTGTLPTPLFSPSLGVNLEAPQGEADSAGQPMPFVDIYRTARPFVDLNTDTAQTTVDSDGWPTATTLTSGGTAYARTKLLQGALHGSVPDGNYTLVHEGTGHIGFGTGIVGSNQPALSLGNGLTGRTIPITLNNDSDPQSNAITMVIRDNQIDVKNIRLIMPGGTCKNNSTNEYNHSIHVYSSDECATGFSYVSFVERLIADRNEIIFNPQYLAFLQDFKTVRMMNFMEATPPSARCRDSNGNIYTSPPAEGASDSATASYNCVISDYAYGELSQWESRAKMSHASWGGSSRTPKNQRKGVPVEVLVALANQTKTNPWFTLPHYADDDYVENFATYVKDNLDASLNVYLEYSNEAWNSGFIAFYYAQVKGIAAGYNTIPAPFSNNNSRDANYFARLRYYSHRATEIANIWTGAGGFDSHRLIRVAASFQGDTVLSKQILEFENTSFDALAIAPYFYGCSHAGGSCAGKNTLVNVTTVDEIFAIIDDATDPSALQSTINKIRNHATIATDAGVKLVSYEGGQHLTSLLGGMGELSEAEKASLRGLFQEANRDSRMKDRYISLLNAWKDAESSALFTLYTLPQSYYRYGNWGLKEHLGQSRADAPKYDAAMTFQETIAKCWWSGWNRCQ